MLWKQLRIQFIFFECAINLNPKYYQAYNRLGDCYYIKKHFDIAIGCYQTSIKIIKMYENEFKAQESISSVPPIPLSVYIGDNYIKLGICLIQIDEKSLGLFFIREGKSIIGSYFDNYDWYERINIKNINEVDKLSDKIF